MHLNVEVMPFSSAPTPRQFMDFIADLEMGIQYDETNDYYIWQTEEMTEPAPFYFDIKGHVKDNWTGAAINSSGTYQVWIHIRA